MAYTTLKGHIRELNAWRNNRARHGYDVSVLDRSLQVARAYDSLLTWRRLTLEVQAKEEARKRQSLWLGGVTLVFVAALGFALGRK